MSPICKLAGHNVDATGARWNAGICFGRCVRCKQDLVRSANGRWQVPRGYRVVWRAAAQHPALDEPAPIEMPAPREVVPPARVTLFERLRAEATESSQAHAQPLDWHASGIASAERPITETTAPEEPSSADTDPGRETAPAAPEPVAVLLRSEPTDFMDEGADADDWKDFPGLPARGALA